MNQLSIVNGTAPSGDPQMSNMMQTCVGGSINTDLSNGFLQSNCISAWPYGQYVAPLQIRSVNNGFIITTTIGYPDLQAGEYAFSDIKTAMEFVKKFMEKSLWR